MAVDKHGLIDKSPIKQKKPVQEHSGKGNRPKAESKKISTDRGKFTFK